MKAESNCLEKYFSPLKDLQRPEARLEGLDKNLKMKTNEKVKTPNATASLVRDHPSFPKAFSAWLADKGRAEQVEPSKYIGHVRSVTYINPNQLSPITLMMQFNN